MLTIILSSSVLYEMVGPISAKAALFLSGSIAFKKTRDKEDTEPQCPASDRSSMCEKIDVITGLDSVIEEKEEGEEAEHGELVPEIPDSECGEESGEECDEATTAPKTVNACRMRKIPRNAKNPGITTIWRTACWRN